MTRGGASRPPPTSASGFSLIRRHQYPNTKWGLATSKVVLNSRDTEKNVGDMHDIRTLPPFGESKGM